MFAKPFAKRRATPCFQGVSRGVVIHTKNGGFSNVTCVVGNLIGTYVGPLKSRKKELACCNQTLRHAQLNISHQHPKLRVASSNLVYISMINSDLYPSLGGYFGFSAYSGSYKPNYISVIV